MILEQLDYWHWFILAVIFLALEALIPGAFFLWMGVAAAVVGGILLAAPDISWEMQCLIFSVLSVASIVIWREYLKRNPTKTDRPTLNRRGEQYVGRTFTLSDPIVNNLGKIRVDDSTWKIRGDDCAAGTKVKVTAVDGVILLVEAVDQA